MKAWIISNPWDDEGRQALTFADTRNEAKSQDWWFEYGNDRLPHFDEEGVTEQTFDDWWSRTYGNEGSGDGQ